MVCEPLDLREGWQIRSARIQRGHPGIGLVAEATEADAAVVIREIADAAQTGLQKIFRPAVIAAPVVVKRGGDLNDSLQESLLRLGRLQPDFFPGLVSFKETAIVEMFDTLAERVGVRRCGQWFLLVGPYCIRRTRDLPASCNRPRV